MTPLRCGVEEPLEHNPQLTAWDEESRSLVLADFSVQGLNRYSFLPAPEHDRSDSLGALHSIASRMGGRPTWVMAWEAESQANRVRGRAYASRLMTSGWEVVERGGLVLGSKAFVPTQAADLTPGEMDARISGCISLLGSGLSADAMCDAPFVESMRAFATTHRLEPSREFLKGLTPLRSAVQYQAKDSRGRSGMVIVSSVPLGDLIEELASAGRIVEVHRGASASAVWQ